MSSIGDRCQQVLRTKLPKCHLGLRLYDANFNRIVSEVIRSSSVVWIAKTQSVRLPCVPDIKSQMAEEITSQFQGWGERTYRVSQLLEWLYAHDVTSWEAMTNLPKALRDGLK